MGKFLNYYLSIENECEKFELVAKNEKNINSRHLYRAYLDTVSVSESSNINLLFYLSSYLFLSKASKNRFLSEFL